MSACDPKRLLNSIHFPARPSHTEGNNCLCLALTLCGREAVQSQGTDEAFEERADNARGRGLKVLSRKLAVTNSLLDNPFEYPSKLSPIFEARRLNFWLNRLGYKSMRQFPAQQGPACEEPRRSRQAFGGRTSLRGDFRNRINLTLSHLRNDLDHKLSLGREIAVQRSQSNASGLGNGVHLGIAESDVSNQLPSRSQNRSALT
jgi:hypothetical protein